MATDPGHALRAEFQRFAERVCVVTTDHTRVLDRTVCEEFRLTFPEAAPGISHLQAVPAGWSRLFFRDFGDIGQLRVDGSSSSSGAEDLTSFPARMFGGMSFEFYQQIEFDKPVTKTTYLDSAEFKNSAGGPMIVAVDRSDLVQGGELCESTWETSIYKPLGERTARAQGQANPELQAGPSATAPGEGETLTLSALELFRYAAITRNSHRLHYDLSWARDVEGYTDLLVPGPLVALLMLGAAQRPGPLSSFSVRMRRALLCNAEFTIDVSADDAANRRIAVNEHGRLVADATAVAV